MSAFSLTIDCSRVVAAPKAVVWEEFLKMMGWETGTGTGTPAMVFRPLGRGVSTPARVERVREGEYLSLSGRLWGITIQRGFSFETRSGGCLVGTREHLSGWPLVAARPFISPRRMARAETHWLARLAAKAEKRAGP